VEVDDLASLRLHRQRHAEPTGQLRRPGARGNDDVLAGQRGSVLEVDPRARPPGLDADDVRVQLDHAAGPSGGPKRCRQLPAIDPRAAAREQRPRHLRKRRETSLCEVGRDFRDNLRVAAEEDLANSGEPVLVVVRGRHDEHLGRRVAGVGKAVSGEVGLQLHVMAKRRQGEPEQLVAQGRAGLGGQDPGPGGGRAARVGAVDQCDAAAAARQLVGGGGPQQAATDHDGVSCLGILQRQPRTVGESPPGTDDAVPVEMGVGGR